MVEGVRDVTVPKSVDAHFILKILERNLRNSCLFFIIFIRPSKTGHSMGSPVAGGVPTLSGAYLQDYASYAYEILWV